MTKTKTENAAILHDAQMKRLMEVREVLAYVASQVVDDFQGMGWREVLKWIERPSGGDREDTDETGTVRYDVVCRLRSPLDGKRRISVILHVEGQNRPHPAFLLKKRMCCYLARLVASQKGKVFGGDDYGSLAPVVSVWLILNNPRWDQGRIVEWTMEGKQKTDLEEGRTEWKGPLGMGKVVAVCVPDAERVQSKDMAGLLGIYLSRKIGTKEKVRLIERDWDLRFSKKDEEKMAMFEGAGMDLWNEAEQSGIQKGRKEGREEGIQKGIQKGIQRGILKGRKEGREEGLQKGILKGRRNFAKAILSLSVSLHAPLEQAMDLLKVPRSEREEFLALIGKIQERKRLH